MPILLQLFLTFFKIGAFTFGGGYAMLSIITDNCVERKGWITHDEMMDITVIAETTPGPVAINCATFVGYKKAGLPGAIFATLGVVLPSFIVIYAISMFLEGFLEVTLIANAFKGIKIGVGVLILDVGMTMIKKLPKKPLPRSIAFSSFAAMMIINLFALDFSSIALMLIAGVISLALFIAKGAPDAKGGAAK